MAPDPLCPATRAKAITSYAFVHGVPSSFADGAEFLRDDGHKLAQLPAVTELDHAGDLGEQGVIFAASYVEAGLQPRAALAHDDGAAGDKLSAECFYAKPLRV